MRIPNTIGVERRTTVEKRSVTNDVLESERSANDATNETLGSGRENPHVAPGADLGRMIRVVTTTMMIDLATSSFPKGIRLYQGARIDGNKVDLCMEEAGFGRVSSVSFC